MRTTDKPFKIDKRLVYEAYKDRIVGVLQQHEEGENRMTA